MGTLLRGSGGVETEDIGTEFRDIFEKVGRSKGKGLVLNPGNILG